MNLKSRNFIYPKVSFTKPVASTHHNKLVLLNLNTDIYPMLLVFFLFKLICPNIFGGMMPYSLLPT